MIKTLVLYIYCSKIKPTGTNGPVNANLISGPSVSTKTNKTDQGQPRVIIYINIVELESPIIHAKFTSGSEEDF